MLWNLAQSMQQDWTPFNSGHNSELYALVFRTNGVFLSESLFVLSQRKQNKWQACRFSLWSLLAPQRWPVRSVTCDVIMSEAPERRDATLKAAATKTPGDKGGALHAQRAGNLILPASWHCLPLGGDQRPPPSPACCSLQGNFRSASPNPLPLNKNKWASFFRQS